MGNNPQKVDRQKQIQGYLVNISDGEQAQKHFETGNQYLQNEDYNKAKEFFHQSLKYNSKNIKVLVALSLLYKRENKFYEAFQCILNKTLIENGYEDQIEDKKVQQQNRVISLTTEFNNDDQEMLQIEPKKKLDSAKRYYILNKALIEILPLMKEDFVAIIQKIQQDSNKFELMFFIEQYKEKFGQLSRDKEILLIEIYHLLGFHSKLLNLYLEQLKQQPNDNKIIQQIIKCYEQLNNQQKVNEYQQILQKISQKPNLTE